MFIVPNGTHLSVIKKADGYFKVVFHAILLINTLVLLKVQDRIQAVAGYHYKFHSPIQTIHNNHPEEMQILKRCIVRNHADLKFH